MASVSYRPFFVFFRHLYPGQLQILLKSGCRLVRNA
jgi:hypothetical protein